MNKLHLIPPSAAARWADGLRLCSTFLVLTTTRSTFTRSHTYSCSASMYSSSLSHHSHSARRGIRGNLGLNVSPQGHFHLHTTGGAGDRTAAVLVAGRPTLPPQQSHNPRQASVGAGSVPTRPSAHFFRLNESLVSVSNKAPV